MPSYPQAMDIHAGRYSGTSSTANIDGSATEPSVAFGDDQDTGMYSPNPNKIAFTTGGAQSVCIDSDGIDLPTGKVIKVNGNTILTATGFTGTAEIATNVTVADESSDTTCFPLFAISATGNLEPKSGSNLTFNSSSGTLTATTFSGTTFSGDLSGTVNTTTTAATQSAGNNSTKLATTAYVDAATSALVDSAPETLNTLDELAEALGDDDDIANTLTTNIATKLPLAGGTMTGNIAFSGSQTVDGRDVSADGSKLDGVATSANNYTHPNHSGDVTSSADGATTIAADAVTGAKIADDAVGAEHIEVLDAALQFGDSVKAQFGTGNDLEIYHDGSHSFIDSTGTGYLLIQDSGNIYNRTNDFRVQTSGGSETMLIASANGAVELYYDNSTKLSTTSAGLNIHEDTDKVISFSGGIGEIGSVPGFQGLNTAGSAITSIGMRGTDIRFATGNAERLRITSGGDVSIQNDSGKFTCGTGDDLQIYHDGSYSYIKNSHAGGLWVSSDLVAITNGAVSENMAKFTANGSVELFYNHVKKLETASDGVAVTGDMTVTNTASNPQLALIAAADGIAEIQFGDANDAVRGNIVYRAGSAGDALCFNGYNNTERMRIDSNGVVQIQDSTSSTQGNSQLLIRKGIGGATPESITRANSYLHLGGTEWGSNAAGIYTLSFGYTNSTTGTNVPAYVGFKETSTSGYTLGDLVFGLKSATGDIAPTENLRITSGGVVRVPDNGKFTAGASDDLQIFHSGTNSVIDNNTGGLYIRNNVASDVGGDIFIQAKSGENSAKFTHDSSVELYHDNSKKFETATNGIELSNTWNNLVEQKFHYSTNSGYGLITMDNENNFTFAADVGSASSDSYINFKVDDSEKVRITSDGRLRIGMADFTSHPSSSNSGVEIANSGIGSNWSAGGTGAASHLLFNNPNGVIGSIQTSGSATSFNTSSDYRLKENEVAISDGITRLKTLKPYRFNFKKDKSTTVDGFFAHEVTAVPEAISGEKDGTEIQSIDQSKLVPLLTAAIQEAITKIETLETLETEAITKIETLETEVITNASEIVNNESRIAGCTSNISGVIDEDEIESKTKIQDGINKVKALNSYQVRLKADNKIRDAFISRDVQIIYGREETSLIPTLTAALKESIQKIEALEAKVSALEAK